MTDEEINTIPDTASIEDDDDILEDDDRPILTQKDFVIRNLKKMFKSTCKDCIKHNHWDVICEAINPSIELEIFCINFVVNGSAVFKNVKRPVVAALSLEFDKYGLPATCKPMTDVVEIKTLLKRVKQHLIHLDLTVLEAYEKRKLAKAIYHVHYQDEHFPKKFHYSEPESQEEGWEARVEALPIIFGEAEDVEVSEETV